MGFSGPERLQVTWKLGKQLTQKALCSQAKCYLFIYMYLVQFSQMAWRDQWGLYICTSQLADSATLGDM